MQKLAPTSTTHGGQWAGMDVLLESFCSHSSTEVTCRRSTYLRRLEEESRLLRDHHDGEREEGEEAFDGGYSLQSF